MFSFALKSFVHAVSLILGLVGFLYQWHLVIPNSAGAVGFSIVMIPFVLWSTFLLHEIAFDEASDLFEDCFLDSLAIARNLEYSTGTPRLSFDFTTQ